MSVTATLLARYPGVGGDDQHLAKIVGDTSYPTGGYVLTPANFTFNAFLTDGLGTGLPPILPFWIVGQFNTGVTADVIAQINPVTGGLQFFVASTGAEVDADHDVSAFGIYAVAYGH